MFPSPPLKSAVLLLTFKRLDTTQKVLQAIGSVKPQRLYISSDGPRSHKEGESEQIQAVRDYVTQNVDWDCEVKTLFREENLGCKYAVFSAMKWFFDHEEAGIILEDDCLPNQSFFWYCAELLEKYQGDRRIAMISGRNDLDGYKASDDNPYFFSSRGLIWGWATWRRTFETFDVELGTAKRPVCPWKLARSSTSVIEFLYRRRNLQRIRNQEVSSWAYPWSINMLLNRQLAIIPTHNMIRNIGFDEFATHTLKVKTDRVPVHELSFPCFSTQEIAADSGFSRKLTLMKYGGLVRFLVNSFAPLRSVRDLLKRGVRFIIS
ncbi:MAG: nucleotide-diphospho-sugar transferase [Cyanobacteria bacterium J06636_16]